MRISDKHPKVDLKKTYNDAVFEAVNAKVDETFVQKVDATLQERIEAIAPELNSSIDILGEDIEALKESLEAAHEGIEITQKSVSNIFNKVIENSEYIDANKAEAKSDAMKISNYILASESSQAIWNWGLLTLMVGYALVWVAQKLNVFG